jgi:DNA polymerase-3 subunit gamma/tau
MAYQVLARKYRPQRFSDVIGQDHVTRTLLNALAQGRTAHGYIFSGHRGIGKTTIARILAMALNCRTEIGSAQRPTPEPCGVCDSCTEIRSGNAVDVIEIDAATNRGIDEIRELRDAARYRPARDRFKIYILDEAHQITDAAFNALLKTLEEPPDHIVFMMATTQPEDIPQTIRSRCQHFSFHAVKFDDILAQLRDIAEKEEISAEDAALAQLAEAGDGSMRDALSIMDQAIASAPSERGHAHLDAAQIRELMGTVPNTVFERLLEAISQGQTATVIEQINGLLNAGNSASQLARQFVHYLRNTLMARIDGESSELLQISPDERARAARSAALFSEEDLTRFLQIMLRTFDELNYRQEQRFHLELGLIKLVHLGRLLPVEELLSKLPVSSGTAPSASASPRPQSSAPRAAAPAAPPRTLEPAKPAFSPFEADRNRKITGEAQAATAVAETAPAKAPSAAATSVSESTSGALALATEPKINLSAGAEIDLDRMRDTVSAALDSAGHNTAATLLASGKWRENGGGIEVEVALGKTMLGLTMNAEAEKISREALRSIGVRQKLSFVPGEGASKQESASPRRPAGGSIQAAALDHPLVKQAQELFQAEVRSVLDLRPKK